VARWTDGLEQVLRREVPWPDIFQGFATGTAPKCAVVFWLTMIVDTNFFLVHQRPRVCVATTRTSVAKQCAVRSANVLCGPPAL